MTYFYTKQNIQCQFPWPDTLTPTFSMCLSSELLTGADVLKSDSDNDFFMFSIYILELFYFQAYVRFANDPLPPVRTCTFLACPPPPSPSRAYVLYGWPLTKNIWKKGPELTNPKK